jgi:hypothetical protein
MAKRKRFSISKHVLEIREIADHHTDTEAALKEYYGLSRSKEFLPAKFVDYSKEDLSVELHKRIEELEKTSSLTLLSFLEAKFKIDYQSRCRNRTKGRLSNDLRVIYKKKADRASLENEILRTWKNHFSKDREARNLLSELTGAFKYRHWLAHGRYWEPKLGRPYDYYDVYVLSEKICNTLSFLVK